MKPSQPEILDRVEFRWRRHEEHFARLLTEAARAAGRSESDQARELLKTALGASDQVLTAMESLHQEIAQLQEQLRQLATAKAGLRVLHESIYQLRDELATAVVKLLTDAGKISDSTARKWAEQAFDLD